MREVYCRANLLIGIGLVLAGVAFNPWLVGTLFTSDGGIDDTLTSFVIVIIEVIAVLLGTKLILARNRARVLDFLFCFVAGFLLFLLSLSLDACLGLLQFPTDNYHNYTNPAGAEFRIHSRGEFDAHVRYNSLGFRDKEFPQKKDDSSKNRILVVGDSFTEGYGVEQAGAFPALLTSRFDGTHFINAGKSGADVETCVNIVLKRGINLDLDGVLFCVYANDIWQTRSDAGYKPSLTPTYFGLHRILYRLYPRIYTQFAITRHRFTETQSAKAGAEGVLADVRRRVGDERYQEWRSKIPDHFFEDALTQYRGEHAMSVLTLGLAEQDYFTTTFELETTISKERWRNAQAMLSFLVEECRRQKVPVFVVFIPDPVQYDPRFFTTECPLFVGGVDLDTSWLTSDTDIQAALRKWSQESNVPFFDLTHACRVALAEGNAPLNYLHDTHWNVRGHQVAADAISDWLEQTPFPCLEKSASTTP